MIQILILKKERVNKMLDLCKLLGVAEGEEFKLVSDNSESKYIIVDNILNLVIDNRKPYVSELTINDINAYKLKIIKLPKKKQFSQDTLNFFKMIDKKYKWIAKDKSGDIFGFEEKPKKDKYVWLCEEYDYCLDNTCCIDGLNQSLFNEILWEDEEPVYIDDYVER